MILLLFSLLAADPVTEPIGPAFEGRLQCYGPDRERRTCRALAGYTREPDGRILNQAHVLVAPDPPIVMHTVTEVTVRDGAVCGRRGGVETATFTLNGDQLDPETSDNIRRLIDDGDRSEVCTRYVHREGALWAEPVVDGGSVAGVEVLWVSPNDGFTTGR